MKLLTTPIFLLLFTLTAFAQNTIKQRKVVQVLAPQTLVLNSQTNATFGGKNRNILEIVLPKNTVEWYYSFTTTKDMNTSSTLNLLAQVTKLYDPTGITAMATTSLFSPSGVSVCDIYLLDATNQKGFIEKGDKWQNTYKYIASGTRENYTNGTITINNIKQGTYYLGVKNPSLKDAISVTVEVVAIIEDHIKTEPTDTHNKAQLLQNLALKAFNENRLDDALELYNKVTQANADANSYNKTGLIYLIKDDYINAADQYTNAIVWAKKQKQAKNILQSYINQIIQYQNANGELQTSPTILELLQDEINKLK